MSPTGLNDKNSGRWPVWKIALVVYPPVMGAAAVNIFFLSLMLQRIGFTALTPVFSVFAGIIAGIPLAWGGGVWIWRTIDVAERKD